MFNNKKVAVIIPTYNAEHTIKMTVDDIPRNLVDEILIINDASTDGTLDIVQKLNITVITHEKNGGYIRSQKTGYTEALRRGADIVIMLHSDYQYDPKCIPAMLETFASQNADAVFGSRMHSKKSALRGGMHWWRFIANIALTALDEAVFHLHLTEYHTGYRGYSKEVLRAIPYMDNGNTNVFDIEMIAQLAIGKYKVAEIPIPTRYEKHSQSLSFAKSTLYGIQTIIMIGKYYLHRARILHSPIFMVVPNPRATLPAA